MKVGIIIPAYNEERTLSFLVKNIFNLSYNEKSIVEEVIVVNDGSTDGTGREARESGAHVLTHAENKGKGEALKTGFRYALKQGFDGVITMDSDQQHDWKEIPSFLKAAERSSAGIIIGNRMGNTKSMPLLRLWTNRVTSRIVSLLARQRIEDSQSGYRFIKEEVLRKVNLATSHYDTESEIIIKASRLGYRIDSIPISTIYHDEFVSKIKPFPDTYRFIKLIAKLSLFKKIET